MDHDKNEVEVGNTHAVSREGVTTPSPLRCAGIVLETIQIYQCEASQNKDDFSVTVVQLYVDKQTNIHKGQGDGDLVRSNESMDLRRAAQVSTRLQHKTKQSEGRGENVPESNSETANVTGEIEQAQFVQVRPDLLG